MTMHLAHPALTTSGKRRGKQKYASADHKRRAEQLDQEWQALQKRWGIADEERKRNRALKAKAYTPPTPAYRGRDDTRIPSLDTGHKGAVTVKQTPKYTGNKIVGIGTMHKSNAVPIFSDQEAKDISSMRR
jgi:hypothetical protein